MCVDRHGRCLHAGVCARRPAAKIARHLRDQGQARHPHGCGRQSRPLREGRRHAHAAGEHEQAHDVGGRVPRAEGGAAQARRSVQGERACLAHRRRAVGQLGHVRAAQLHGLRSSDLIQGITVQSGNDACIVLAEGIAGTEEAFAKTDERLCEGDRAHAVALRQFDRLAGGRPCNDRARACHARPLPHRDVP